METLMKVARICVASLVGTCEPETMCEIHNRYADEAEYGLTDRALAWAWAEVAAGEQFGI